MKPAGQTVGNFECDILLLAQINQHLQDFFANCQITLVDFKLEFGLDSQQQILLADEIVSELDHVTAQEIMELISDAQKKFDLTAIMVHHDMALALEYANRVAVIKDGEKILEIGVEGERIVDFQTGNLSQQEILEMYGNNP